MAIKIESGIELPPREYNNLQLRVSQYAKVFEQMGIGDSFVIPKKKYAGVFAAAKRNGISIETRKADQRQIRVWRTK